MEKKFEDLVVEHLKEEEREKDNLVDKVNQLVDNYNKIVDYTKYNEEYIEAILFMSNFKFMVIVNNALKNKAKYTEYETLNYTQTEKPKLVTTEKYEKSGNSQIIKVTNSNSGICCGVGVFDNILGCSYETLNTTKETIKECIHEALKEQVESEEDKEETQEEKYKKSVCYVKDCWTKFPKEIVYNVYRFLKDVWNEDIELRKYEDNKDTKKDNKNV